MSIRSISFHNSDFFYGGSNLSEATKSKLIALGIDPSNVTSESQAQVIIEAITQQKVLEASNQKGASGCSSEREVISRIRNFAFKIGLNFSQNASPKEMIESLSTKINQLISSQKSDSSQNLILKNELDSIITAYSEVENNRVSIYNSMVFSANMNKYLLGL